MALLNAALLLPSQFVEHLAQFAAAIARTEPYADPWESTPDDTCTPIRSAVIFQRRSSEPSFWNFERFTGGRLFAIPATVKLEESPGRAGGLPGVVIPALYIAPDKALSRLYDGTVSAYFR